MSRIIVPYETSGQELGETRQAMAKTLMKDVEKCISQYKHKDKFYILVHAKPFPGNSQMIKIKIMPMNVKPSMQLSCMLFCVDNQAGKLTLDWVLPGSWPTWSVGGTNEPVPEVIASLDKLGKIYDMKDVLAY